MTRLLSHLHRDSAPRPARAGLLQPVAAVLTDRIDDVVVAEAAARTALARHAPLLLIAVMPPNTNHHPGPASAPVRAVLARVMPKVGPYAVDCVPEVFHPSTGRSSRLAAAKELLVLAGRHRAADVVAARHGPRGLDAHTLIEAAALRGGPRVHAIAPAAWVPLRSARTGAPGEGLPHGRKGDVPR
ncbi:universal stress protein [Streptomyces sp. NPDC057235]|uniref:universal stress protein n=1 Tax=Streptomyces sp. NPDC057235 TaxID=3346058 RepID=UPI0036459FFD